MKLFNSKGDEVGEFIPTESNSSSMGSLLDGPSGCGTALVFNGIFVFYWLLQIDRTPSPTWYWVVSWVGITSMSVILAERFSNSSSCLGALFHNFIMPFIWIIIHNAITVYFWPLP